MKLLIALLFVLAVGGLIVWTLYQQRRTSDADLAELDTLRAFRLRIQGHVLTQAEVDPTDPFVRVLLDEVTRVERERTAPRELR